MVQLNWVYVEKAMLLLSLSTFACIRSTECFVVIYSSFFLGKVTALGVLCCFALFVCLALLASFFLPSHLSFKNMYIPLLPCCIYTE